MNTAPANSDEAQLSESRILEIHHRIKAIVQKVLRKESCDFPDLSYEDMIEYMVHTAKKVTSPEARNFEQHLRSERYKAGEINIDNNFHAYLPLSTYLWGYICGEEKDIILLGKEKSGRPVKGKEYGEDLVSCSYATIADLFDPQKIDSLEVLSVGLFDENLWFKLRKHPFDILFNYEKPTFRLEYRHIFYCIVFMIFCKMLDLGYTRTSLSA